MAVIGAGVSGLTFARSLRLLTAFTGSNMTVTVFDSRKNLENEVDRGLGIWDQSQSIMSRLGVSLENSRTIRPALYKNTDGRILSESSYTQKNADRVMTLTENHILCSLGDESLCLGKQCIDISDQSEGVRLTFKDKSVHDADIVVGADGVKSWVRNHCFPKVPLERVGVSYACITDTPAYVPDKAFETLGPGGRRFSSIPLRDSKSYWFATLPPQPSANKSEFDPYPPPYSTHRSCVADLLEFHGFHKWHDPIPQLIGELRIQRSLADHTLICRDIFRGNVPKPGVGRCVLIGDAAHPIANNLAQGAALGIEDGWELAVAIANAISCSPVISAVDQTTLDTIWQSYQSSRALRITRCSAVTNLTQFLSDFPFPVLRDIVMTAIPRRVNAEVFDRFLDYSLVPLKNVPSSD